MRTLLVIAFLSMSAYADKIQPPQPDYNRYGSYSRQMTVYENTQVRLDALELEKYRKFREEIRRQTPEYRYCYGVETRRQTYNVRVVQ